MLKNWLMILSKMSKKEAKFFSSSESIWNLLMNKSHVAFTSLNNLSLEKSSILGSKYKSLNFRIWAVNSFWNVFIFSCLVNSFILFKLS